MGCVARVQVFAYDESPLIPAVATVETMRAKVSKFGSCRGFDSLQ